MSTDNPDEILDQHQAVQLSKLSAKTLERHALAGQECGRRKVGRRILFIKRLLLHWLASQAAVVGSPLDPDAGGQS